jgi:hypothetical protein
MRTVVLLPAAAAIMLGSVGIVGIWAGSLRTPFATEAASVSTDDIPLITNTI